MMLRSLYVIALALITACSPPAEPRLDEIDEIAGDWQKEEQTLPPISLELVRRGEVLHARLRLSGMESNGTAVLDGATLRVQLPGRDAPLIGTLVSPTELDLGLDSGRPPYRLRKQR